MVRTLSYSLKPLKLLPRSSLAIISAYSVMLFCLVMILRFGSVGDIGYGSHIKLNYQISVEPDLQPPSPTPPSTTLRGLYLLACIISSIFGAAIGIFFFTFAKYWVSAVGGFTFGWFLLAIRQNGLVTDVFGRWALLCSLTV